MESPYSYLVKREASFVRHAQACAGVPCRISCLGFYASRTPLHAVKVSFVPDIFRINRSLKEVSTKATAFLPVQCVGII